MNCPACSRPVATARPQCLYCGAALSPEVMEAAELAARRVLQSGNLVQLEAAAQGLERPSPPRRYLILDTQIAAAEDLAAAFSVSAWEARQWRASSRYRLLRVTSDANSPIEEGARARGVSLLTVPEAEVAPRRLPAPVVSFRPGVPPWPCSVREESGAKTKRDLVAADVALIVSGPIQRERVREQVSAKARGGQRLEEGWLVHLHVKGESRPWEIDPGSTVFEGAGLASAHMSTMDLVRQLEPSVTHDRGFKTLVPALSPGVDPAEELEALGGETRRKRKEAKTVVLDNVAQFREYSAWRSALELQEAGGQRSGA